MAAVLLALLSGAPALVYQVVWTRMVALAAGNQVEAISAVLVAFFGGLALGARWLGPLADSSRSPLRWYAVLEIGAGTLAAGTLIPLTALAGSRIDLGSGPALLLAAGSLLPATTLLGGTLPALVRASSGSPARRAGWIVGANTLGSVAGVGLAVWAIPTLGLRATLASAAVGSLAVGVAAWVAARRVEIPREQGRARVSETGAGGIDAAPAEIAGSQTRSLGVAAVLAVAAAAGAASLAFEVLAARMSALRLGSSLFAWALVLALFLTGLAVGNLAFAGSAARSRRPLLALGWIEAAAAVALVAGSALLSQSPAVPAEGVTPRALLALVAGVTPAALLMGGAFPYFVRLAVRENQIGRAFGRVSAWNTAGGISGALLAPFVLLPMLGPSSAAAVCAGIDGLLAVALLLAGSGTLLAGLARAGLVCAGGALAAALPSPEALSPSSERARVIFVAHGRQATAVVAQVAGRRDLIVDGDPEASTGGEARRTQELLATLPLLLHPGPERFLEVGLGSGITLATAARFPLSVIDCVEIADSVLRASGFFAPDNALGEASDRVRILPGDARVFLARHPRSYDVVVANTLHPWSVGATGLYSAEYFARLAGALRPGGIAAQWLPVERIGAESLAAILRTFFQVFPNGALWWGAGNLIALGSDAPIATPDESVLRARLAASRFEPGRATPADSADPAELRASRIASAASVRAGSGPGEILSDDRPVLEARSARRADRDGPGRVWGLLVRIADVAAGERDSSPAARAWLQALAARDAGNRARAEALEAEAASQGLPLAVARAQAQPRVDDGYRALAEGRHEAATRAFRSALLLDPDQRDARYGMAGVALLGGRDAEAIAELRALVERFPADAAAHNELSGVLGRRGERQAARQAARRALDANPFYPEALANAGLLAVAMGDLEEARRLLERLRGVTPLGTSREEQALRKALVEAEARRGSGVPRG